MLTPLGLARVKNQIMRLAVKNDEALNAILQDAVRQINQLIEQRRA